MLVVLADDLTGAAAYAALLRTSGLRARVLFEPVPAPDVDVAVYDLRTRDSTPNEARTITLNFIRTLRSRLNGEAPRWALRVDTTVRGHVQVQIQALLETLGYTTGVLCPAYPEADRRTRAGHQWVGPDDTESIPLEPHLRGTPGITTIISGLHAALGPGCWWIPDAVTPTDLHTVARAIRPAFERGEALIVDSGPLMAALTAPSRSPRVLVVQGSTSSTVAAQIDRLRWASRPEVEVIYQPVHGPNDPQLPCLATTVRDRLRQGGICGLVLGGGLTAETILEQLEARALRPIALPDPIVALTSIEGGPFHGLWVVSKGGRVGSPDALVRITDLILTLDHADDLHQPSPKAFRPSDPSKGDPHEPNPSV